MHGLGIGPGPICCSSCVAGSLEMLLLSTGTKTSLEKFTCKSSGFNILHLKLSYPFLIMLNILQHFLLLTYLALCAPQSVHGLPTAECCWRLGVRINTLNAVCLQQVQSRCTGFVWGGVWQPSIHVAFNSGALDRFDKHQIAEQC